MDAENAFGGADVDPGDCVEDGEGIEDVVVVPLLGRGSLRSAGGTRRWDVHLPWRGMIEEFGNGQLLRY